MVIGQEVASFIDNKQLNKALQTAQQIYRILQAAQAIATATKALSLLSVAGIGAAGLGAAAVSGPAGLGVIGAIALAKGGPTPPVGANNFTPSLARSAANPQASAQGGTTIHAPVTFQFSGDISPERAAAITSKAGDAFLSRIGALRTHESKTRSADYVGATG